MSSEFLEPTYEITFMFKSVLVPFNGKEHAVKALKIALDYALRYGSRVTVLYVKRREESDDVANKILEKAKNLAKEKGVEVELKVKTMKDDESVAVEIINEINEGLYDVVILGSRGKTCSDAILYGSTAVPVALCAPCTVIIVR